MTIGLSMGGFGALLYGGLLRADFTYAIVPQTDLRTEYLDRIGDARWPRKLAELNSFGYDFLDIERMFQSDRRPRRATIICAAENDDPSLKLDIQHARRIAHFAEVNIEHIATESQHGLFGLDLARRGIISRAVSDFVNLVDQLDE
jgi:hypothetical protein